MNAKLLLYFPFLILGIQCNYVDNNAYQNYGQNVVQPYYVVQPYQNPSQVQPQPNTVPVMQYVNHGTPQGVSYHYQGQQYQYQQGYQYQDPYRYPVHDQPYQTAQPIQVQTAQRIQVQTAQPIQVQPAQQYQLPVSTVEVQQQRMIEMPVYQMAPMPPIDSSQISATLIDDQPSTEGPQSTTAQGLVQTNIIVAAPATPPFHIDGQKEEKELASSLTRIGMFRTVRHHKCSGYSFCSGDEHCKSYFCLQGVAECISGLCACNESYKPYEVQSCLVLADTFTGGYKSEKGESVK